ncbi:MAG TPA: type II toxin-antitoxin system VapC family toxin [Terriglobales bacterium]|nr:type II toxin-antitoxin system VapC family toxin [Terriglobales bacterium]
MKRYLLDTNVVSELRKPKPHGGVLAWLNDLQETRIYLSAVTIGELQTGVELTRAQDPHKAAQIEAWIDPLEESFQVLPMDALCFRQWARLMSGRPDNLLEDIMIAATARVHDLAVATRNEKDFTSLGVQILNPFKTAR